MLPSRKQRREMARKFGLVKKNPSFKDRMEILDRSIKAGQAIHQAHLQYNHNRQLNKSRMEEQAKSTDLSWKDIVNPDNENQSE